MGRIQIEAGAGHSRTLRDDSISRGLLFRLVTRKSFSVSLDSAPTGRRGLHLADEDHWHDVAYTEGISTLNECANELRQEVASIQTFRQESIMRRAEIDHLSHKNRLLMQELTEPL